MGSISQKDPYEAIVKIQGKIISKKTGKSIEDLKVHLSDLCDMEHSGAEGEIIDLGTGKVIYHCHKQTLVDK